MKLVTLIFNVIVYFSIFLSVPFVQAKEAKPNVLFIAVDDLNDWVGKLGGHPQARTPNMDLLSSRGLLFTKAYCSAPSCNASRSSVLTGMRPSTTGIYINSHDWRQASILKNAVTLPRHFKNSGYLTMGAGKLFHAHTFFDKKNLEGYSDPDAWDAYFPSKTQQMPEEVVPETWPLNSSKKFYRGHFDWAPLQISNLDMADAKVVDWASKQLAKTHKKPLFLSVGIYRPHVPWYVPKKYYDRFPINEIQLPKHLSNDLGDIPVAGKAMAKRHWHKWINENNQWEKAVQAYLASLAFADDMVGNLIKALDKGPLSKNTIIILWGDHGYHLGEKESWEKFALWEDTTHVPLIIVDPRRTKSGTQCESPVSLLDLYPTLIELCGLRLPPQKLEGRSLVNSLIRPMEKTGRVVITTQGRGNHAVRSSRYRYIRYADGSEELYDHKTDSHEWNNLSLDPGLVKVKSKLMDYLPKFNASPVLVKRRE
ncbi:MAG: iduronate-2-sulfatase [Verrucomicrobiales bacterium]|nr:iduronate-2-sulfatase [Verrucomicrobiales bacterium]